MKTDQYVLAFEVFFINWRAFERITLIWNFTKLFKWLKIIWPNQVEIYTSHYNLSKPSAPYTVSTENNQIIISFQTDQVSLPNGFGSDMNLIMIVMISKSNIDNNDINKNRFYAFSKTNNSLDNGASIWNRMMIVSILFWKSH